MRLSEYNCDLVISCLFIYFIILFYTHYCLYLSFSYPLLLLSYFKTKSSLFLYSIGLTPYSFDIFLSKAFFLKFNAIFELLVEVVLDMLPLITILLRKQYLRMQVFYVVLDLLSYKELFTQLFLIWLTHP